MKSEIVWEIVNLWKSQLEVALYLFYSKSVKISGEAGKRLCLLGSLEDKENVVTPDMK